MKKIPVALTIAGSDPSGGAGIQADLKTFHRFGVYGMSVLTLLTIQNTRSVEGVICVKPRDVARQLKAVLSDIPPDAAKTGALGDSRNVKAIAKMAARFKFPLVVDPVMVSKHGARLMDRGAVRVFREQLLPLAAVVTPNIPEAEILAGMKIIKDKNSEEAARKILNCGAQAVVIKGGHAGGIKASDFFMEAGGRALWLEATRVRTKSTHGTGCAFSAAITAGLAKGYGVERAVSDAKKFITAALKTAVPIGRGIGPVNHGL